MTRTKRHNIEGAILDVPLRYDSKSQIDIEEYPDLIKHPLYTPTGERVMLTIEDACGLSETVDGTRCIDCGSCIYYRQAPDSLLGVCSHKKHRRGWVQRKKPTVTARQPSGQNSAGQDMEL